MCVVCVCMPACMHACTDENMPVCLYILHNYVRGVCICDLLPQNDRDIHLVSRYLGVHIMEKIENDSYCPNPFIILLI